VYSEQQRRQQDQQYEFQVRSAICAADRAACVAWLRHLVDLLAGLAAADMAAFLGHINTHLGKQICR
jgi:hypothetical protein